VVFVRPPSAPELRVYEEETVPRTRGWDQLLERADVRGVHFADDPAMQGLVLPEYSHLSRACALVFTDAYVRATANLTPRSTLGATAPPVARQLHRQGYGARTAARPHWRVNRGRPAC
jgi:hypothetical protein